VLAVPADGSKPARSSWQSKSRATFSTESRNPHFPKFNDKIVLGLVGSIVGGAIYRALCIPPDAGMVSTVHRRDSRSGRGDRWSAHDVAYCR
jgi:hypothetical protein